MNDAEWKRLRPYVQTRQDIATAATYCRSAANRLPKTKANDATRDDLRRLGAELAGLELELADAMIASGIKRGRNDA